MSVQWLFNSKNSNYSNGENFRHDDRLEQSEVFLCFAYGLMQMAAKHAYRKGKHWFRQFLMES